MIECRIPISDTPAFRNRVRLIMASVREFYPDAIERVSTDGLPGEALKWGNTRAPYMATISNTWRGPFEGDHILHLDGDVFPVAPFDGLFGIDALCGVQAHHSPYGAEGWRKLFAAYGLPPPVLDTPYSGFGIMFSSPDERLGPRGYFNSGMVFGPRHLFERLAPHFAEAVEFLRTTLRDVYWIDQVAFTLAIHAAGLPTQQLPLRYNFPNRPTFDMARPEELAQIKFLHAMDTGTVHRDRDFASDTAIAALVGRDDLTGSNEVLRQWLAR